VAGCYGDVNALWDSVSCGEFFGRWGTTGFSQGTVLPAAPADAVHWTCSMPSDTLTDTHAHVGVA
jgi:hypothetical protein